MIKQAIAGLFAGFTRKQTLLNLAYLLAGFACGLVDLILLSVSAGLFLGLVAVPIWAASSFSLDATALAKVLALALGGILAVPASVLLWFFPAILEQHLAAWLLHIRFSVSAFWTAEANIPLAVARYIVSAAAWRRFLFGMLRVPLGLLSFVAVLVVVPAAVALLSMPAVFIAGYRDLIVWKWRIDSIGESLVVFLAALILAPLALHALNWLSRASGSLAKLCLQD